MIVRRRPIALTAVPVHVTASVAQELRIARDALAFQQLDLVLRVLSLQGTSVRFNVDIETGMQIESEAGWKFVGGFASTSSAPYTEKKTFTGLLRYVRYRINLTGTGPSATFMLDGMATLSKCAVREAIAAQRSRATSQERKRVPDRNVPRPRPRGAGKTAAPERVLSAARPVMPIIDPGDAFAPLIGQGSPPLMNPNILEIFKELKCKAVDCPHPRECCGGDCVDKRFDPKHCGGCGQSCDEGEACSFGECWPACSDDSHCDPYAYCYHLPNWFGYPGVCRLEACAPATTWPAGQDCVGVMAGAPKAMAGCCQNQCVNLAGPFHCGQCGRELDPNNYEDVEGNPGGATAAGCCQSSFTGDWLLVYGGPGVPGESAWYCDCMDENNPYWTMGTVVGSYTCTGGA